MRATAISGDRFSDPSIEATMVELVTIETVNEPVAVVKAAANRKGSRRLGIPKFIIAVETSDPMGEALMTPPKAPPAPVIIITAAAFSIDRSTIDRSCCMRQPFFSNNEARARPISKAMTGIPRN